MGRGKFTLNMRVSFLPGGRSATTDTNIQKHWWIWDEWRGVRSMEGK